MLNAILLDLGILCFCILLHIICRSRTRSLPLPPGPTRWPIVGNALIIPLKYTHKFYQDLGENLGSKIMYLETLGQPIIVINDFTIAQDLLDKRSSSYSSRPKVPMLTETIKFDSMFGFMPYGDEWRLHRRLFQHHFSEKHLPRIQDKGLEFIRKGLLPNILASPSNFHEHLRDFIGGFSLSMTYGIPVQRRNDPLVRSAESVFAALGGAAAPGKYFVNIMPQLKYVPEWMPGAGFKRYAKEVRRCAVRLMNEPFQVSRKESEDGTAPVSFVSETLEQHRGEPDYEFYAHPVKQIAFQVFGAFSETTVASAVTFILAMLIHPGIQEKAQREVDSVVGYDRLPEFSDIPNLPYMSAIVKEVLRWNPPLPFGLPHLTSYEDVYGGYYIPKDCIVRANTYAILHDKYVFPDPEEFKPERFLIRDDRQSDLFRVRQDVLDPEAFATFGFGRRICPGAHIALSTLYITAASLVSLFDIAPALDAEGRPIHVDVQFSSASLVSEPLPFQCRMMPRKGKDVMSLLKEYLGTDPI